jgi:hypothetical protein
MTRRGGNEPTLYDLAQMNYEARRAAVDWIREYPVRWARRCRRGWRQFTSGVQAVLIAILWPAIYSAAYRQGHRHGYRCGRRVARPVLVSSGPEPIVIDTYTARHRRGPVVVATAELGDARPGIVGQEG